MTTFTGKQLALWILILVSVPLELPGQTSRGTVSGLVTDPAGAAVVIANVELRNTATNVARTTTSNEAGFYRFDAVDPGPYAITVTSSGFRAAKTGEFPIAGAQVASLDVHLAIGDVQNSIEVTAAAVQLQTESPVRGGT